MLPQIDAPLITGQADHLDQPLVDVFEIDPELLLLCLISVLPPVVGFYSVPQGFLKIQAVPIKRHHRIAEKLAAREMKVVGL